MDPEIENFPPMRVAALQLHEFYSELRSVGFTEAQALTLLGSLLARGFASGVEDESDEN